jgi:hypothetical protein
MEAEQWADLDWATTVLAGKEPGEDVATHILEAIVRNGASCQLQRAAWLALDGSVKGAM